MSISTAPRAERPTRSASHGQWAVDGRAPLNHNEEVKAADNGLNVRERIERTYAIEGFDSIDPDDLRGRMRWWGLYTQRKQGIDGGRTAVLEPHELEDEYFMLRIRIDGGRLSVEQLRTSDAVLLGFDPGQLREVLDLAAAELTRPGVDGRVGTLLQPGTRSLDVLRQVLGELHVPGHPGESTDEAGRNGPPRGEDGPGRVIRTGLCRHEASVVSPFSRRAPRDRWRSGAGSRSR